VYILYNFIGEPIMHVKHLIIRSLIVLFLVFAAEPAADAQQLTLLYTGNTQGAMLPLFK